MKPFHGRTLVANAIKQVEEILGIQPGHIVLTDKHGCPVPGATNLAQIREHLNDTDGTPPASKRRDDRKVKSNTSIGAATVIASGKLALPTGNVRIVNKRGRQHHKDTTLAYVRSFDARSA